MALCGCIIINTSCLPMKRMKLFNELSIIDRNDIDISLNKWTVSWLSFRYLVGCNEET